MKRTLNLQCGATLVEYVIAFTALGLVVVGVALSLNQRATAFNSENASGFGVPYPKNYIEPPPPTPTS